MNYLPSGSDRIKRICDDCYRIINPPEIDSPEVVLRTVSENNLSMLESANFSDFKLVFNDNKEQKVHKSILSAASRYFDLMFNSTMEEARNNFCIVEFDFEIIQLFLRFLYAGILPENLVDIAIQLFEVADYYKVENLKEICKRKIYDSLNIENAVDTYAHAHQHNYEDLKIDSWKIIKRYVH